MAFVHGPIYSASLLVYGLNTSGTYSFEVQFRVAVFPHLNARGALRFRCPKGTYKDVPELSARVILCVLRILSAGTSSRLPASHSAFYHTLQSMPVDIADFEKTLDHADDGLSVVLKLYNSVTDTSSGKGPSQILDVSSVESFVRVIVDYKAAIVAARNKEDTEEKQTYEGPAIAAVLKAGTAFERHSNYIHELFISSHSELVQAILTVVPTHVELMLMAQSLGSSMATKSGTKETGNKNGREDRRIEGTTLLEQVGLVKGKHTESRKVVDS